MDHWSFDPFLVVVAVIVVLHEMGLARLRARSNPLRSRRRRLRSLSFYGGLGVLVIAVVSPIDYWASDYFFVHMVEHILIILLRPHPDRAGCAVAPPPLRLPGRLPTARRASRPAGCVGAPLRAVGRVVTNPWFALVAFNLGMVLWHVPALFDLAENNQDVHIWLMHATFFVTGVLFWLQIIPSYPFRLKATPLWQIGAIISTNVVMFVLAMALSVFTANAGTRCTATFPA